MNKWYAGILVLLIVFPILITGCTSSEEKEISTAAKDEKKEVIATVNDEKITSHDLEFYKWINLIQIAMYREADQKKYQGKELEQAMKFWDAREQDAQDKNMLLTQIIRLRAMSMLALEKGHSVAKEEIDKELEQVKSAYGKYSSPAGIIEQYGQEQFWDQQRAQYERIVLAKKVQQDVVGKVKEANPKAGKQEIQMLAEKKYEELLVSQVGTLNIKILN